MIPRKDEGEQRLILAVLLTLAVYWGFFGFRPPPPEPESGPVAEAVDGGPGSSSQERAAEGPDAASASAAPAAPRAETLPERRLPVRWEGVEAELTSEGGSLARVRLVDQPGPLETHPLWRWLLDRVRGRADGPWEPWGEPQPVELVSERGLLLVAGVGEALQEGRYRVSSDGAAVAERVTPEGIAVRKRIEPAVEGGLRRAEVRFTNTGDRPWTGTVWVGSADHFEGKASRYTNLPRPVALVDGDLETLNDARQLDEGPRSEEGEVAWLGIGDRYFLAAFALDDRDWGALRFDRMGEDRTAAVVARTLTLPPGGSETLSLSLYLGPKDLSALAAAGHDLERSVNLGFFGFFARILLALLSLYERVVGNWGVAIILLTVTVKAAFWPLTRKSIASGRRMQQLSPKLQELNERYKDDPQKRGEAQMKLFREEGVNPMSGCLPMLIQLPVWWALYSVLLFSADLYHADFLYLRDLSLPDPTGLLPTLVGVLMVLQMRLTPTSPNMDPFQQRLMRLMPLMFVVWMYVFPSGLTLYILVNTALSILQMWLINKAMPYNPPPKATAAGAQR